MDQLTEVGQRTMYLVLILSAVPVAVATVIGILVGLVQTVTQIQEQTLPFGIKLISVSITLTLTSHWYAIQLRQYTEYLMTLAFHSA
ncbi:MULTISPECIES: type III secretion system export apparatus subunit SctS [Dyella]|uniref:EscS/YscS/HrcS family type III secretion system export apparatus protein n=2 Tax=Dyella TaxID=231454 RepID=A0A4R0Z2J1_9GAMM|nr:MULTISPECIES: type III secretion system export apparatus subunit SctS [Dyella]TBR38731.1 EscS/YscS/HrcS family type III secretion system export apparatus protein [Dyella terrae]TCI13678.1 EscS/YscS/HrcS family type III secretion system export apparatus protein [Dyella soli]